ncbi:hypothetical protein HK104_004327, partial [Borealophlyctis nickersoniae]
AKTKATKSAKSSPAPPAKRVKVDDSSTTPEEADANDVVSRMNLLLVDRPFKNPKYSTPKKFKNLKQITASEKNQAASVHVPTFWNIEAPPSLMPQKKYCDITGLEAPYTEPHTGLRYYNADVYQAINSMNRQYVQEYLKLRNAAVILK